MDPLNKRSQVSTVQRYAPIMKIDEEQRMVFGYATTESRDQQGEIVRLDAVRAALPDYMKFGAVRAMHQNVAVGTAVEATVDDKGLWFGAHVVDDDAWKKVKAGVYKGFSIGGRVTERDTVDRSIITGLELTEISLVDRPANPDATYTVIKRDSGGVLREQPVQKWDCGMVGHQHMTKAAASDCMSDRARSLQKAAVAAAQASATISAAAQSATEAVAKGDSPGHEFHGNQHTGGGSATEARTQAKYHTEMADKHRTAGDRGNALHDSEHLRAAEAHEAAATAYENAAQHFSIGGEKKGQAALVRAQEHAGKANLQSERLGVPGQHVGKKAPKDDSTGRFSTHANLAASAHGNRAKHDRAAAKAKDEERTHRAAAVRARDSGDATAMAHHEHIASEAASLADIHGRAAQRYSDLAAQHEAATAKLLKENRMKPENMVVAAEAEAVAAMALLNKALEATPTAAAVLKAAIDHAAEGNKARTEAMEHLKDATAHEQAAATARESAKTAHEAGNVDESNKHQAEADQHDIAAVHHHSAADSLHELHAHHAEQHAASDSVDHGAHGDMAKEVGQAHAAGAHHAETMMKMHQSYAAKGTAGHHVEMAKGYGMMMSKRQALAKRMGDLQTKSMAAITKAAEAKKIADEAAAKAAAANVVPVKGLTKSPDGWLDVRGVHFGKKEYNDEQRRALVTKGFAMPDGSYPIEDKDDLGVAIKEIGRSKDAPGTATYIAKRATELKAEDQLPKDFVKSFSPSGAGLDSTVTDIASVKTPESGGTPPGAETEAGRQAAGVQAGTGESTTGSSNAADPGRHPIADTKTPESGAKPAGAATEAEREAAGREAGVTKRSPERVSKGMGMVSALAQMVSQVESLAQSSAMEQIYEGDKSSGVPAAIQAACAALCAALRTAVTEETAEVSEGDDMEVLALAAKAAGSSAGLLRLAKEIREVVGKADSTNRVVRKKLAESLDKAAEVAKSEEAQKAHDAAVSKGAKCAAASNDDAVKSVMAERDRVLASLRSMSTTVAAVAKEVTGIRKAAADSRVADQARIEQLEKQVKDLGEQPLPPKGVLATAVVVGLAKGDDVGNTTTTTTVAEGDIVSKQAALRPEDRANARLAHAAEVRAKEQHGTGRSDR